MGLLDNIFHHSSDSSDVQAAERTNDPTQSYMTQDPQLGVQQDSSIQQDSSNQDPQLGSQQDYAPQDTQPGSEDSWSGEQQSEPQAQQADDFSSPDQSSIDREGEPTPEGTDRPDVDPPAAESQFDANA